MKRFGHSNRGLSPIVSAIFLIGIMVAAIAASFAIIVPNLQKVEDGNVLGQAQTALTNLDKALQQMISSGKDSQLNYQFYYKNGLLIGDNSSFYNLTLSYPLLSFAKTVSLPYSRVMVQTPVASSIMSVGQTDYFSGSQNQKTFALNVSTAQSTNWAILNSTRSPFQSTGINNSLGYRMLFLSSYQNQVLKLQISFVKFVFEKINKKSSSDPLIKIIYAGKVANTSKLMDGTQFFPKTGSLSVILQTKITDGSPIYREIPFTFSGTGFYLDVEVSYHLFKISF